MTPSFVVADSVDVSDEIVHADAAPVAVRRYSPRERSTRTRFVWVHGGAFSGGGLGQLESHAVAGSLAAAGWEVIAVDYRLVPSWSWWRRPEPGTLPGIRYPLPLDDVSAVVDAVSSEADGPLVLGGASAGACLAAASALRSLSNRSATPDRLILAYGTFHAELPEPSHELKRRIRGRHGLIQLRRGTVERMNRNYAGSEPSMRDPYAFPGGHALSGLPPTLLLDADRDSLRASGETFARELGAAHVEYVHDVVAGSRHGFLDRPHEPAFATGIAAIAHELRHAEGMPA